MARYLRTPCISQQRWQPQTFLPWARRTSFLYHSRLCSRMLSVSRLSYRSIPALDGVCPRSLPPTHPCPARTSLFPSALLAQLLHTTPSLSSGMTLPLRCSGVPREFLAFVPHELLHRVHFVCIAYNEFPVIVRKTQEAHQLILRFR